MRDTIEWTIERGEEDAFDVLVSYQFCAGRPAQLYGLPENCYPAEPDEIHFERVTLAADMTSEIELTDDEYDAIEAWILENPPEPDYPEEL